MNPAKSILALSLGLILPSAADTTYTYLLDDSEATLTGFTESAEPSGALTIPATVDGYTVVAVDRGAFRDRDEITSITFASGSSVTSLGPSAFAGCTGLTALTLPAGVTDLPMGVCEGCTALASVSLPSTTVTIGAAAFAHCSSLATLELPSSLASLGESAFLDCSALTSLTVPSGVTSLPDQVFDGCRSLASLSLPAQLETIGERAFHDNDSLITFIVPENVTSISNGALGDCSALESVQLNASLNHLGDQVFLGCHALTALEVDASNTEFSSQGGVLFNASGSLLRLAPPGISGRFSIPSTVAQLSPGAFAHCSQLEEIELPESLVELPEDAFYYASALSQLEIPSTVSILGSWCLAGTGLTGITLPSAVNTIGDDAFHFARSLAWAFFEGDAPEEMGETVFDDTASGFTVFFPANATGFTTPTWLGYPAQSLEIATALAHWLVEQGYSPGADPEGDENGDGISLLTAYALGLDPSLDLAASMPQPVWTENGLSLTFTGNREGVTYSAQSSADLQSWTADDVTLSDPDESGQRTATLTSGETSRFLRLVFSP
ncbi:hypothetical protein HNR46_002039 [Haloferula luteola]|uniref:Leucine-rich repeat domain-containing protein n=1 Tax=Haloferula luteola TaxID=595692 RepID=A0A840VD31_9BACT|nr:leucine-rich repeat domain-containing protein [Haloferula luteola]MBB5351800.1 hypothetical protein [Haloferula luteola]